MLLQPGSDDVACTYYILAKCCGLEAETMKDVCRCIFKKNFFFFFPLWLGFLSKQQSFGSWVARSSPASEEMQRHRVWAALICISVHAPRCKSATTRCFFTHTISCFTCSFPQGFFCPPPSLVNQRHLRDCRRYSGQVRIFPRKQPLILHDFYQPGLDLMDDYGKK